MAASATPSNETPSPRPFSTHLADGKPSARSGDALDHDVPPEPPGISVRLQAHDGRVSLPCRNVFQHRGVDPHRRPDVDVERGAVVDRGIHERCGFVEIMKGRHVPVDEQRARNEEPCGLRRNLSGDVHETQACRSMQTTPDARRPTPSSGRQAPFGPQQLPFSSQILFNLTSSRLKIRLRGEIHLEIKVGPSSKVMMHG